jgi:CBS domain-containing protein
VSPEIKVADVMRTYVVAVRERARYAEIVGAMRRFHLTCLPVVDADDHVLGLIGDADLLPGETAAHGGGRLRRVLHRDRRWDRPGRTAIELMTAPPVTVTGGSRAREAARAMYRHHVHQLPVVDDRTHRLIGMVTRSDLLAVYERPDEDIRREIIDDVVRRTLATSPHLDISVVGGTVTVRGGLARHSDALRLAKAIARVDGVITVIDHVRYEHDDVTVPLPHS